MKSFQKYEKLHQIVEPVSFFNSISNELSLQFRSKPGENGLKLQIQSKLVENIDNKFPFYEKQNEGNREFSRVCMRNVAKTVLL